MIVGDTGIEARASDEVILGTDAQVVDGSGSKARHVETPGIDAHVDEETGTEAHTDVEIIPGTDAPVDESSIAPTSP